MADIFYEGILYKQGHFFKTWKQRFFVLEEHGAGSHASSKISYYSSDVDRETVPRGVIPLRGASISMSEIDPVSKHPEWVEFSIQTVGGKVYPLRATSLKDRQKWFENITAAIQRTLEVSPSSSSISTPNKTEIDSATQIVGSNQAEDDDINPNISTDSRTLMDLLLEIGLSKYANQLAMFGILTIFDLTSSETVNDDMFLQNIGFNSDDLIKFVTLRDKLRADSSLSPRQLISSIPKRESTKEEIALEMKFQEVNKKGNLLAVSAETTAADGYRLQQQGNECCDEGDYLGGAEAFGNAGYHFRKAKDICIKGLPLYDNWPNRAPPKILLEGGLKFKKKAEECSASAAHCARRGFRRESSIKSPRASDVSNSDRTSSFRRNSSLNAGSKRQSTSSSPRAQVNIVTGTTPALAVPVTPKKIFKSGIDVHKPLGLRFEPDLRVTKVDVGGQGEKIGMKVGARILSLSNEKVSSVSDFRAVLTFCQEINSVHCEITFEQDIGDDVKDTTCKDITTSSEQIPQVPITQGITSPTIKPTQDGIHISTTSSSPEVQVNIVTGVTKIFKSDIDVHKPLGMSFEPDLRVTKVDVGGQGEKIGMKIGARILSLSSEKVSSDSDFNTVLTFCQEINSVHCEITFEQNIDDGISLEDKASSGQIMATNPEIISDSKTEDVSLKNQQESKEKVEEEARLKAEQEAKEKAEVEARLKAEQEAKEKVEEEARLKAEQEAKEKVEVEARLKAEQEAKEKAEEEARLKAEQETKEKVEVEARLKAEQEAKKKAEIEARLKAEQEAKEKVEVEARLKAEQEAKEREKAEVEARLKAEQEAKEKAEVEARLKLERDAAAKAIPVQKFRRGSLAMLADELQEDDDNDLVMSLLKQTSMDDDDDGEQPPPPVAQAQETSEQVDIVCRDGSGAKKKKSTLSSLFGNWNETQDTPKEEEAIINVETQKKAEEESRLKSEDSSSKISELELSKQKAEAESIAAVEEIARLKKEAKTREDAHKLKVEAEEAAREEIVSLKAELEKSRAIIRASFKDSTENKVEEKIILENEPETNDDVMEKSSEEQKGIKERIVEPVEKADDEKKEDAVLALSSPVRSDDEMIALLEGGWETTVSTLGITAEEEARLKTEQDTAGAATKATPVKKSRRSSLAMLADELEGDDDNDLAMSLLKQTSMDDDDDDDDEQSPPPATQAHEISEQVEKNNNDDVNMGKEDSSGIRTRKSSTISLSSLFNRVSIFENDASCDNFDDTTDGIFNSNPINTNDVAGRSETSRNKDKGHRDNEGSIESGSKGVKSSVKKQSQTQTPTSSKDVSTIKKPHVESQYAQHKVKPATRTKSPAKPVGGSGGGGAVTPTHSPSRSIASSPSSSKRASSPSSSKRATSPIRKKTSSDSLNAAPKSPAKKKYTELNEREAALKLKTANLEAKANNEKMSKKKEEEEALAAERAARGEAAKARMAARKANSKSPTPKPKKTINL